MSVLEIRHEFVDVDARNLEQLYQSFCNQIHLGQWELAKICLQILHQKRLQLNTNLEEFLTDIIRNPTAYCSGSYAIPTPFHLSLLLLEECRMKQYLNATTIESIKSDAIFNYLLAVGDIQPSAQVVQEFQRLHTNTTAIPSELLTDSMADFLVDLWLHEIPRVHTFIRLYLKSNLSLVQIWLIQIHKRALEICFQQLKTLNNEQQRSILIDLLFSLHLYSCESNEFRLLFRDILKKLVIYASQRNQLLNLKTLYECTLNNGYLGRFLSELESEYRRELINNETIILHFLKKNSFENEEFFWKEIYLYLIENKLDLISCVLNDSISLIENRDYSSLDQLLNIEQLSSLHLYIFLLAWTHVRTVNDAIVLYGLMDSLKNKSPMFDKCLKLFQAHTEFITWLYNVRRIDLYHDGASPLPSMSDLLALLHTNSPLSLIHRYLDVPTTDSGEILEKLKKTRVDINDEEKENTRIVRFKDTPDDKLGLSQKSATMIFLGYLSINSVIEKLLSPSEITDEYFSQTNDYLMKIYPLRFRLELLENLFSLVFIQQSELKLDETVEILEQSTNTVSERFISSTQSHITNDSPHTSTNASIRTQISVRRYDNDFEENTQDDLSIQSSSMSSVSVSHGQTISRTGFIITEDILYQLLVFLRDQLADVRNLYQKIKGKATDKETVALENSLDQCFLGCSISTSEQFTSRATKLNTIISETLWRYQLLTANKLENDGQDNKIDGIDREQNLIDNPTIKNMILPIPKHRHSHRAKRRSRLMSGSVGSVNSLPANSTQSKVSSPLVSQILSTRDNLLAICLKEGKITEANEVIRLFNMQDHPLAVEAKFSKLFDDTVKQLSASHSSSAAVDSNVVPTSPLAGLANLASSALGNTSLQNDITPLLELAQTPTVSSTLPASAYFDHEYFLSLTLFDLAINAPTMAIGKTLLDMSQHRLPMLRAIYSPTNTSSTRIKSLNEMINNYLQLTHASQNQSFEDIILDVTLPLDGIKATKTLQYYKRLDEHCRQYYTNEQNSFSIEQQVKSTSELFENDSQAKIDLVSYVRNQPNTSTKQTNYINYFAIFHTYLQNFRLLLEKFPLNDVSLNLDLSKHSPLALVHRIVSRSSDIDLTQLQILTSKLNIDISLAVSLNIIRPLFVDKTIASSSLSSTRRMTVLQQQQGDTFYNRQQSYSILSGNLKKQIRRSATFLRRLTSRLDQYQNEPQTFDEHPEKFIRTLLTKLLDSIRKVLGESNQSYLSLENIDKLFSLDDYGDILNTLPLLTYIDLDRLETNEERICFFTNFYNFFLILSHLELINSATSTITTNLFRNHLERLLFLLTTRINLGQLKQLSLFDIRYYILKQTNLINGLNFQFDKGNPLTQYAPTFRDYQQIQVGLVLNDCLTTSIPFIVLMPELITEQLNRSTREFIQHCVSIENNEKDNSIEISLPRFFEQLFPIDEDGSLFRFVGEYASNNQIIYAMNEKRLIKKNFYTIRNDFSINFEYHFYENQFNRKQSRTRSNSLPSLSATVVSTNSLEFPSQSTVLPKHLIDTRTIAFVQEKSPALGQILQIYVQSVVQNQPIENDHTALTSYFQSLLLSPTLIQSTTSIAEEWFRSIVLNDLTYQHDLLLYLCSILWTNEKYLDILQLFDSLLPSFIVHSIYCQVLRDLALLNLIKQAAEPDHAYQYLRKVRDCHLLVHATLTYLPRFDGPTCLKLLQLCLTSCKKSHQDYIPLLQERLNIMYVYKTLCLSALAQFNKCMEKISSDENQLNMSIEDMAIKKTSSKCLTWQRAEEHSEIDPLAVATMFIYEKEFDMGHKWLNLLKNSIDEKTLNRVRLKLVEEHIHWLLKEESLEKANKILQIIDLIENVEDKWHLCTDLIAELSKQKLITDSKAIPFSRLFIKSRIIQYMLGHFDEKFEHFQGEYERSKLSILATGLALFFNCIPLEQTDSYVQLTSQPLLIVEQLLMNSSVDIAKTTIETLKIWIEKYQLENIIPIKQIDDLIEIYTKKSVQLNVSQVNDEQTNTENKSVQDVERRQTTSTQPNQRKSSQDMSGLGRRQQSAGSNHLLGLRIRNSPKTSISAASPNDLDANLSSSASPSRHSPPITNSIPIKSQVPPAGSSSFKDYLSTSLSNRHSTDQTGKTSSGNQHTVPVAAPSKKLWISDDEVTVCMCCKETQFSMFNRRHHCRRCGRVVCKTCSQHTTIIKDRLARTCNDCYSYLQTNPTTTQAPRQEPTPQTKKFENFRPLTKSITSFKRQSISQLYLDKNAGLDTKNPDLLFGTSLVNDVSHILEEDPLLYSASYSTTSPFLKSKKFDHRSVLDSPRKRDSTETLTLPIVADEVQYQLTGGASDESIRNDFHYDQSPSITLCLSLIELHSNQYEGGKLLIKLCEYLSEQLSTKQRNTEIDYGLVLNIIKNLLFTAKMKLMTVVVSNEDDVVEQQKLIASCDLYNNLVDILNRLNMANCSLPALNDLLQQDTLRKIRNQLLDDERYQLAMDISTRCNLDTQSIWYQWGMAYLYIGQYLEARDKFEKCLVKNTDTLDAIAKQQQRGGNPQDKMLADIVTYLETSLPLKYAMKWQYLAEQQIRQAGQTRASLKYLNSLSTMPRLPEQAEKVIQDEILFYLSTYSDDAHLLDYYIRHEFYTQAFEQKCSLTLFRDHIYLPLLKRNHTKHLFNYILSRNNNSFTHHLRFVCTYLKEQEMFHSLQQLQLFMNDFINAAYTSIKLFTANRTTYLDLFEKRLIHLQKAIECFQHAKIDSEQTMTKVQSNKNRVELQIEITRYVYAQLQRLKTDGAEELVNCPTLFDAKDVVAKLILGLIAIADSITNAFNIINKIIKELNMPPNEIFLPCAEEIGKRRDYRSLQQLLQLIRDNGYTDPKLHDDIIEACVRESGSDVEQNREQDALIQLIKNDDTKIHVNIAIGKLRAAYLIAIRLGKEDKVRLIRDDAQKSGQTAVYDICKKWLENRASEQ